MENGRYIPYNFINMTECNELSQSTVISKESGDRGYIKMITDEYDDYWDAYGDPCALIEFEDGGKEHYTAQELLELFVDTQGNPVGRMLSEEQYALYKQEKTMMKAWFGSYDNGSLEASPSLLKEMSSFIGKLVKEAHSSLFDRVVQLEDLLTMKMSEVDKLTRLLSEANKKNQTLEDEFNDYKKNLNVIVGGNCGQLYTIRSRYCYKECPKCQGTGKRRIVYKDTGEEDVIDCPKKISYEEYWIEPVGDKFTVIYNKDTGERFFVSKEQTKCVMQKSKEGYNWLSYVSTSWSDERWFSLDYFESIESAEAYLKEHHENGFKHHYLGVKNPSEMEDD